MNSTTRLRILCFLVYYRLPAEKFFARKEMTIKYNYQ